MPTRPSPAPAPTTRPARRGRAAIVALYDAYAAPVYRACWRLLGDHHRAEQATAEVFQRAAQTACPGDPADDLARLAAQAAGAPQAALPGLPRDEPESSLWRAVRQLAPLAARVLVLRFGQRLTNQQVARILNRSETAASALTERALTALAHRYVAADTAASTRPEDLPAALHAAAPEAPMDPLAFRRIRSQLALCASGGADVRYARFDTPVGPLLVAYRAAAVVATDLDVPDELFERECAARLGTRPARDPKTPAPLARAVRAVIDRRERFRGEVDLSHLPEFQRRVLLECLRIRPGEVRPYGWLAKEVGAPRAARAVGTAMAHNPIPVLIPCHRVVRSDYTIGEYGCGGPAKKRQLLAYEGVDLPRLERLAAEGVRFLGSATTRIFCLPGCYTGRRVKPQHERRFASAAQAQAAGYRPCKVCRPV